jgi:hypothetical protein
VGEAVTGDQGEAVLSNDLLSCAAVEADDLAAIGIGKRYGYALQAAEEEGCIGALEVHMVCGLLTHISSCQVAGRAM